MLRKGSNLKIGGKLGKGTLLLFIVIRLLIYYNKE